MAARALQITLLMSSALLAQAAPAPAPADAPTASLWSRMWRTPDQRGQALLQQGDAAGAAQTFADPEHKAHAALQAHDYPGAAQTLSGIDTAEAHYNRGNALAHAGDLQGAIRAYEAALKHSPQHTDARHNRDVVAEALKKQKDKNQDSKKQQDQDKKSKEDSKAGDGKDDKPGDKPADKAGDKSKPPQNDAPGKKPSDTSNPPPPSKPAEPAASAPQPGGASAPAAPTAPASPASTPKDDATQARRDAESALGKGPQPVPTNAAKQPPTEKQIAQEQWLRAIPDDPGGLLRRKFLIEHMLRQQGQKP